MVDEAGHAPGSGGVNHKVGVPLSPCAPPGSLASNPTCGPPLPGLVPLGVFLLVPVRRIQMRVDVK